MKNEAVLLAVIWCAVAAAAEEHHRPFSPPCTERENLFEFTEKPTVKRLGEDRYEITFAVKGACDVTVGIVDPQGAVVRHLCSGVLGANAPAPFQKNALRQVLSWNGKDDLEGYVREPEKMRVRVMLGLRPEFDKLLADYGPQNLPGFVWGIAIASDGARVFTKPYQTHGHMAIRHFDHDGNYIQSLVPPPVTMPEAKLGGLSYVEYEPGKKAVHGADLG